MKNLLSKIILIIFIIQILAQIVLMTGINPYLNSLGFLKSLNVSNNSSLDSDISNSRYLSDYLNTIKSEELNADSNSLETIENNVKIPRISQALTAGEITYQRAGSSVGTQLTIDVGSQGNSRMLAIIAGFEGTTGGLSGITVGAVSATLVYKAQNIVGAGNHMELWVITESGFGTTTGNAQITLGSGSTSSWAVHAMLFYGVEDSTVAFDVQADTTSQGTTQIFPGSLDIPENGLLIFGVGNGQSGHYNNNDWDTNPSSGDDGLSPEIEMIEVLDASSSSGEEAPASAVLADAYWISTYSQQLNRQFRAISDKTNNRGSGIIASFKPAVQAKSYSQSIAPDQDGSLLQLTLSGGFSHYLRIIDQDNTSTYVYEGNSGNKKDQYRLSDNSGTIGQIQRVTVYAIAQSRYAITSTSGTILMRVGSSAYASYIDGNSGTRSSLSTSWDLYFNQFYTSYAGGSWTWENIASMTVELNLFNFIVSKLWVVVEYKDVQNPSVTNYGVDDPGTGSATYWAQLTDDFGVQSAQMTVNGTPHALSLNGSGYWTYLSTGNAYGSGTIYSVSSVIDTSSNSIFPAGTQSYTFLNDNVIPTVNSAIYYPNSTQSGSTIYNGTFKVDISDYGIISNVRVNVTTRNEIVDLSYNGSSGLYETNSLFLTYGSFSFVVIVNDTAGNLRISNSYSGSQSNYLPEALNIQVTPNTPNTTQDLSLSYTFYDLDNQVESGTQIRWYLNNGLLPAYNDSTTLPNSIFSKDDNITVSIQPKDGLEFGNIFWSLKVTISDSAPVASAASISPASNVKTIAILTAVYSYYDIDGDLEVNGQVEVFWYNNGVLEPNLNNSLTVDPSYTTKGETWNFKIRVSDGLLLSPWINSSSILITNSAPVITYAFFETSIVYTTDNLVTNISTIDDDSDTLDIIIKWYKNGVVNSTLENATSIDFSLTSKHEVWYYTVQLYDGEELSQIQTVNLDSIEILNSVPIVSNVNINPTVVYSNGSLSITYDYSDNDSDPQESPVIVWYKNNVLIGALNGSTTVDTGYLTKESIWNVSVNVFDNESYSLISWSTEITIRNTPTILNSYVILPSTAYTSDNLVVTIDSFDQDGDSESSRIITWYRNTFVNFTNTNSISSIYTSKGESWYYTIQINDGTNDSLLYTSPVIIIQNSIPVVSSVQINDGNSIQTENNPLNVNYSYFDSDSDSENVSWAYILWYRSGSYNSTFDNLTSIPANHVTVGTYWYYIIEAFDGFNFSVAVISSSTGIGVEANIAPIASYVNISFVTINATTSDIIINYTYSDPNTVPDSEAGTIFFWYKNGELMTQYTSQTLPSTATTKGDIWIGQVKPRDGKDYGLAVNSTFIIIGNTAPSVSNIQITPGIPKTSQDLVLSYTWSDIDPDTQSGTVIEWYIDGNYNSTFDGNTIISSIYTKKGEEWFVRIRPSDGTDFGSYVGISTNITIINTAPTLNTVKINETLVYTEMNITISYQFIDVDGDPESGSLIYWYRNGFLQTNLNNYDFVYHGLTNKTESWYFIIVPSDGLNSGISYQSNIITIQNSIPTISNILINGTSTPYIRSNESFISTYDYLDADNDIEFGTNIKWYKNGVLQTSLNNLNSVPASYLFKGEKWNVTIQPKDGSAFGSDYTSFTFTIQNTAPQITNAYLNPTTPVTTDNLAILYVYYDYDGDSRNVNSIIVQWYRNGTHIPSLDNKTSISSSYTNKSDLWYARISIDDNLDYSNTFTTINITIINSKPTLSMVSISPATVYTTDNLNATYLYNDADGDEIFIYSILWFRNGIQMSGFNGATIINSGYTNRSESWYFKIIITDLTNQSIEYSSDIITILNSAPTIGNLQYTQSIVYSNGSIIIIYDYSDSDMDNTGSDYIYWYKDGILVPTLNQSKSVSTSYLTYDSVWWVNVIPYDGINQGANISLNSIIVRNTPAIISNQVLNGNNNVSTTQNLVLTYIYYDIDSHTENKSLIIIEWYNNSLKVESLANKSFIESNYTLKGQTWFVRFRVFDGFNYSSWYQTPDISIINSAPIISLIILNNATSSEILQVNYTYIDYDGDIESSSYIKWYKNTVYDSKYDNQTFILANETSYLDFWSYSINPFDGSDYGEIFYATLIRIQNTAPESRNVVINPTEPLSNDTLSAIFVYYDYDGHSSIGTAYYWYKNNGTGFILMTQYINFSSIPKTALYYGDQWYVQISSIDAFGTAGSLNSSSIVIIKNTPPTASGYMINSGVNVTTTSDLTLNYVFNDEDNQSENTTIIFVEWYKNTQLQNSLTNLTSFSFTNTTKSDVWYAKFKISDGLNYSIWFYTPNMFIINSQPTVIMISLNNSLTSIDDLYINYTYFDVDGDSEFTPKVYWFKNGVNQTQLVNNQNIFSNETKYNEIWYYQIIPYDGNLFGNVYTSPSVTILNTVPLASNLQINPSDALSNGTLTFQYNYYDVDGQPASSPIIYWYKNSANGFIMMSQYTNSTVVDSSALFVNESWIVSITPFDGLNYGTTINSSVTVIKNTPPLLTNFKFITGLYNEFYLEDELLTISYDFNDKDLDLDKSSIIWFRNGIPVPELNNKKQIPNSYLKAGEVWTVTITTFDGFDTGNTFSNFIQIESRPHINEFGLQNTTNQFGIVEFEGLYTIWFNATDSRNDITETTILLTIPSKNISKSYPLLNDNGTSNIYSQNIDILDLLVKGGFAKSEYKNLIGSNITIQIVVKTTVVYSRTETISSTISFSDIIKDNSAPRVKNANYLWNNANSPTNITFYAEIEDFGSDIQSVTLYYYFKNATSTESSSAQAKLKLSQSDITYQTVEMTRISENNFTYTILYSPTQETEVFFDIGVVDGSGNSNSNAFPKGIDAETVKAGKFIPSNLGISTDLVIGIVLAVLAIALIFTFVGIKKFRSTELVGLDKELIIAKVNDFKNENELTTYLDLHTLGIIVSFFDQRHGPIPIIVTPEILKDNYNLLVDLSDMSFSSARFSGNFEDEIYSTYNFNPAPGQFINIISFGYALNRPEARGGAENITLNILIHKNVSELINQFIDKFQDRIHDIHKLMDKNPDKKEEVTKKIKELRMFLSKIILTYENLYGTTELLDTYDKIFDN
jgi:hypothetical protein